MSVNKNVYQILMDITLNYKKQLPLYQRMLKLSYEQERILNNVDDINTEALVKLLNKRQDTINKTEIINESIKGMKDKVCNILHLSQFNIRSICEKIDSPVGLELGKIISQLTDVICEIKDVDKSNEIKLKKHMAKTKIKLADVQGKKKVNQAYQQTIVQQDGVFIDYSK